MNTLILRDMGVAALLISPSLGTIARWTGWYVALSLGAALLWIVLVSIGQAYQRRHPATLSDAVPPAPAWAVRYWQRQPHDFAGQLGSLGESLAPGSFDSGTVLTAPQEQPVPLDRERAPV